MPLTGIDDAWQSRLPQGWAQMPDGSYGPSSGLPDWLKQLIPSPGAATPNAPGLPSGASPQGLMPGGGALGYQAATPGAPSMGFPAQGGPQGPQVMPPQNSTIPPGKQVGPWTNPFTDGKTIDPSEFQGSSVGGTSPGGLQSMLSMIGAGNPYARAAIAAGGVMSPAPAETGELPLSLSGARPQHPASTGAMPPGGPMPSRPYSPTPQNYPSWPTVGAQGSSPGAVMAQAPPGNPSDTPRPPRRPKNLGGAAPASAAAAPSQAASNPRFSTVQYQVPGSGQGGPLSRSPIYTALNLFGGRS